MATAMTEQMREQMRMEDRHRNDAAESMLRRVDERTTKATGISLFHLLTLVAIGGSIALFLSGRERAGIFVGLWPPTFQALKSAAENH